MFKTIFWRGVKTTIPLFITLAILFWCISIIEGFFGPPVRKIVGPYYYFPGLGFIVGLLLIFAMGIVMNIWLAQRLYELGDRLVKKIPLVKTLYNALVELMNLVDRQKEQKNNTAVLLDTDLGQLIAFISVEDNDKLPQELANQDKVAVYIPMSYQIGGYTTFLERSRLKPLSMPFDKAMSYVLTAGVVSPSQLAEREATSASHETEANPS